MESKDPAKTVSALQVFVDVFQEGEWELSLVLGTFFPMRSPFSGRQSHIVIKSIV